MNAARRAAIYKRVVDAAEPFRFGGPLATVASPDISAPADPHGLVEALQAEFPAEDLLDAGVVVGADRGLAPVADLFAAPILVLRRPGSGEPFALVGESGVFGGGPALLAAAEDALYAAARGRGEANVYVTADTTDAAALRAFSMPAAPAAGLADPAPADVDRLCDLFSYERSPSPRLEYLAEEEEHREEVRRREEARQREEQAARLNPETRGEAASGGEAMSGGEAGPGATGAGRRDAESFHGEAAGAAGSDATRGGRAEHGGADRVRPAGVADEVVDKDHPSFPNPCFVPWRPAGLDPAPVAELESLARGLKDLFDLLGVGFRAQVWRTDARTIERLRYFARHGGSDRLRDAAAEAAYVETRLWGGGKAPPAARDLSDAARRFLTEGLPDTQYGRPESAGHALALAIEEQVLDPLRREALAAAPVERALLLAYTENVGTGMLLAADVRRSTAVAVAAGSAPRSDPRVAEFLKVTDRTLAFVREINRCRDQHPARRGRILIASATRAALPPPSPG